MRVPAVVPVAALVAVLACVAAASGPRIRHRRVSDAVTLADEPIVAASKHLLDSQVQNKHTPKFKACDDYKPEVAEEAPRGTNVIQVFAEDLDGPDSANGHVTYSIVSQTPKFVIDPKTGWVSTNDIFNRDEPDREKLVHVTVKASDNGRPQFQDVCTLAVRIRDINDNAPVFDRANYDIQVAQDTPVNTQIMRISATDVDEGDNQKISYELSPVRVPGDLEYFRWHYQTGVVELQKKLDKPVGHVFQFKASANDSGVPPKSSTIDITIEVTESTHKPPSFISGPGPTISLSEGYNELSKPIATYTAKSNNEGDNQLFFSLVRGRTEQTNKDDTFRAVPAQDDPSACNILLAKPLSYEKVSEYTLTLQVQNAPGLFAEALLNIQVMDENNQAPVFTNVESGYVLEHEPPGTIVMTVSAVDNDGTYPNNKVSYSISERNPANVRNKFEINPDTGVIMTKEMFDREEQAVYALTVEASDGAPSSVLRNKKPNVTPQKFRIAIADKNDNPPYFPQQLYRAEVPEDQDVGSKVIEVRAEDKDEEASVTTYSILSGNVGNAFSIEEQTGFIRVAKPLDYETIKRYYLTVSAWDGQFQNETNVEITVLNVNDIKPQFKKERYVVQQQEELVPSYPIVSVSAIDPDIGDPAIEQNITYYLDPYSQTSSHFTIDAKTGDVRIVKKLDRDLPNGYPTVSLYVFAKDENGGPTGIENYVELVVNLEDINDNAPYLDMPDGLVWAENRGPGDVGELRASDYDTMENGPPFTFELDGDATNDIKSWFAVKQIDNGSYILQALVTFDREKRKYYDIPVRICDHKNLCDVSRLRLTIGDVNDNPMERGESEIFVYNYEGKAPDTQIGRVYVKDPDDWDLPDKTFTFTDPGKWERDFALDRNTGMITMKKGIRLSQEIETFTVDFVVEDPVHGQVKSSAVTATVNVTVQRIPKEAVIKSGSVRILGAPEDFVRPDANGFSKRDKFKTLMSRYLNATYVDVFTVLPSGPKTGSGQQFTDVRFSAHGSPYYKPEKLEGSLTKRRTDLEQSLGLEIVMIHIDECIREGINCEGSCVNELVIHDAPYSVMTNTSSFVGVNATVNAVCACSTSSSSASSCHASPCLNNGTCRDSAEGGYRCECPANNPEYFGSNCELVAASFNGQGWSWQPGLPACGNSHLSLYFNTQSAEGTILYAGPSPNNFVPNVTDFLALEIEKGKARMFINFGTGTRMLQLEQRVDDGRDHLLTLKWTNDTAQMELDDKSCSNDITQKKNLCFVQVSTHDSKMRILNTNGPLHVGGVSFGGDRFSEIAKLTGLDRKELPVGAGFVGCIKNLTFSAAGKLTRYDLGNPADGENYAPGCNDEFVQAVVALGINTNFLIAILVCLAVILILVIILAVYRKRRHVFGDKDMDCDIRENIINYEDEGGGEGDQTGYDLSVLRMMSDGTPALHAANGKKRPSHMELAPDIQSFLQTDKDRIDHDPEATPFDDLRHYAYEGDGNSGGDLSSLNSGTSDADLEFDYLHNFGPRFKKLADMYGEEPDSEDDDDEDDGHVMRRPSQPPLPLPSESWC